MPNDDIDRLSAQLAKVSERLDQTQRTQEGLHESVERASERPSLDAHFVPRPEVYDLISSAIERMSDRVRPLRWLLTFNCCLMLIILMLLIFRFSVPITDACQKVIH